LLSAMRGVTDAKHPASRYSLPELGKISEHVSRTERVADEAEEESVELKKLEYFQQQLMSGQFDVMDAVVSSVKNFGIFVELTESLVQGLIHVSTLEDDFYHFDEQRERLVGKRTKRIIQIGDKLKVQVERVDVFKRQIDFRVVKETVGSRCGRLARTSSPMSPSSCCGT
jgi:ribonuclease R